MLADLVQLPVEIDGLDLMCKSNLCEDIPAATAEPTEEMVISARFVVISRTLLLMLPLLSL